MSNSNSHRNTGVSCNYKLKLPKFKDLCIKSEVKVLIYVANIAIVKQLHFKILSQLKLKRRSLGVNCKVNNAKA